MGVEDGFIPGIYNYCDRWCDTCGFTARCRAFADAVRHDASLDPSLKAVVDAAPLPHEVPSPIPRWLQDCIDEMHEAAAEPASIEAIARLLPRVAPEHLHLEERARGYAFDVAGWLQSAGTAPDRDHADPRSILERYCALIPPKVYRALIGLADSTGRLDDGPADHDGSAKVALLAIERSRAAWIAMAERGLAPLVDAERFVSDLGRLADDLDRVFPRARAFVRPGFDEPLTAAIE